MVPHQQSKSGQPLLETKITVPPLSPEFVHRPRLTKQIDRGVRGPLTLLSAPAGFGKTSLVIDWAAQSSLPVAWLTLDQGDNTLVRFFRHLTGALQEVASGVGLETLSFIQSTQSGGVEMGLTLLINEIAALPQDIALVLDNLQVIEDVDIRHGLDFLLRHAPQRLHLVIASRSEPDLDLAFLRAKGWLTELGADDLRFTATEVSRFFRQTMGLDLPAETVQALAERTEGWITALQLAAISLRNHSSPLAMLASFQGDAHYLVDFLSEEVLYRQPEQVREFLLRSSILDVLCAPLCEAVVDPESPPGLGASMLQRLEHANIFLTPLDQQHEWFRYHQLFADFLRHVLDETRAAEVPVLHKRAAIWFEQHGNRDEAFKHALASGDEKWAADLFERNVEALIKAGELLALTRWIGKLPSELIDHRPSLSLPYAWGLIAAYQLDDARFWLDRVERLTGAQPDEQAPEATVSSGLWNIQGGLAVCRSMLALISGDFQGAAKFSRAATDYLQADNPFVQSMLSLEDGLYFTLLGDTPKAIETLRETARIARGANNLLVLVVATCQLAEMQAMQGHLSQALATLQKAQVITLGPDGKPLPLAGIVDSALGEILRERDQLSAARAHLERGLRSTHAWWSLGSLDGLVALARLLQSQGDVDGAQACIDEAARLALSTESSQWDDVFVSAVGARLALQQDDLTTATRWMVKGGMLDAHDHASLQGYPYHVYEFLQLTQARYRLAVGRSAADASQLHLALEILQSLLSQVERFQRVTSRIEILVVQAMAEYALGQTDQAASSLMQALALGEPEDYRRIYLDEGRRMAELLALCQTARREAGAQLPSREYIDGLLEALQPAGGTARGALPARGKQMEPATAKMEDGFPVCLSARELEVLALIAAGKSNREIAALLCLSLNTVKRHAYNIYAKLEVSKRTHAVSRARSLGLIP